MEIPLPLEANERLSYTVFDMNSVLVVHKRAYYF